MKTRNVGDRVKSLILLEADQSICGDTQCRDVPVGAPGTITTIHKHGGYGVLFDADVHRLSCYMDPEDTEYADCPTCAKPVAVYNPKDADGSWRVTCWHKRPAPGGRKVWCRAEVEYDLPGQHLRSTRLASVSPPTTPRRPAMARPLTCTRCGSPCGIAEDVQGYLDWGLAAVGDDGIIRPADPEHEPPSVMSDSGGGGSIRACCTNPGCLHQWRPRRRFDPISSTA